MSWRNRPLLASLVGVLALGSALIAPSAQALSPKAAVPAAKSGITAVALSQGGLKSCAILSTGQLKCWGYNYTGGLGLGDSTSRGNQPGQMGDFLPNVNLGTGRKAKAVVSGYYHTCAILDNGTVKCWGPSGGSYLGLGDDQDRGDGPNEMGDNLPAVNLGTGRKAKAITAGNFFTCAILDNGKVKCWGDNSSGQLGYDDTVQRGGSPSEMGDLLTAVNLGTGRKAKAISASSSHTCALLDNGSVKCWGSNGSGQLGYGDTSSRGDEADEMAALAPVNLGTRRKAKAIASGADHACAILDNGWVKCWGDNQAGQLGLGDTASRGDGPNEMGDNLPYVPLGAGRKAKSIASHGNQTCVILDNGTAKCWGSNDHGQLGIGNNSGDNASIGDQAGEVAALLPLDFGLGRRAKAITAGVLHTCALLDNKTVKCWGYNTDGELGLGDASDRGDNEAIADLPAVNLGVKVKKVQSSGGGACAILQDNSTECWGYNDVGETGNGNTNHLGDAPGEMGDALPALDLGTGRTVKAFAVGSSAWSNCAILDDKTLKCWGWNNAGQLGYEDTNDRGDQAGEMGDALPAVNLGVARKPVAVAIGGDGAGHTCALLDNKTVKCWGSNDHGQLGIGNNSGNNANIGDQAGEMAALLPVDLGKGRKVKAVSAGDRFTCAILDNGKVKCWGFNGNGELGIGDTLDRGDGPNEMGDNLPYVNLGGRKAKAISSGISHTCALLDNATVKCWGGNGEGSLGLGNTIKRGDSAEAGHEMGRSLPAVNLGAGRKAKSITAGGYHTCALLDNGKVKCWGWNAHGELGLGDTTNRGDGPDEMGNALGIVELGTGRRAIVISAGEQSTCALLDNATVKCWGTGDGAQLGLGDTTNRGDGPNEMGDNLPIVAFTG